jgi:pimeloyl-ACP methyl ester carboxylesterase
MGAPGRWEWWWWVLRLVVATCLDVAFLPLAGVLLLLAWAQSSSRHSLAHIKRPSASGTVGVLLLHGSGFNRIEWLFGRAWLACFLPRAAFSVHAIDYAGLMSNEPAHGIDTYAHGPVRKQMQALRRKTGISTWLLIGHSMGGLVARYYDDHLAAADGITIVPGITIASPWGGSPLIEHITDRDTAPVRYKQMRPGSRFLLRLRASAQKQRVRYATFGSDVDAMVPGRRWSLDCDAPDVDVSAHTFSWSGHYALIAYPPLWQDVTRQILAATAAHRARPA